MNDPMAAIGNFGWLAKRQTTLRCKRMFRRATTWSRLPATLATLFFITLYAGNGAAMLAMRPAAATADVVVWLCGGMMLYLLYHTLRCVYGGPSEPIDPPAETLWIGGAPITTLHRWWLLSTHAVFATAAKTALLLVALWVDAADPVCMAVGVFIALSMVDIARQCIAVGLDHASTRTRRMVRAAVTTAAVAVVLAVGFDVASRPAMLRSTLQTILSTFDAVGNVTSHRLVIASGTWLRAPARLAAAGSLRIDSIGWTMLYFGLSLVSLAGLIAARVQTEVWRCRGGSDPIVVHRDAVRRHLFFGRLRASVAPADLMARRSAAAAWRYRWTILGSVSLPAALCLSPLAAGELSHRWLLIVGGVAFCTAAVMPSALRIDFRSDYRRWAMLRSWPMPASSMAIGQIIVPVMITWLFQAVVIGVAAAVLQPGVTAALLWTGLMMSLAVATFAAENAMFLTFPYRATDNGLAMVVRAKLTFLAKSTVLLCSLMLLAGWTVLVRRVGGAAGEILLVVSASGIAAAVAAGCFGVLVRIWSRLDVTERVV